MGILTDVSEIPARYKNYVDQMRALFSEHGISGVRGWWTLRETLRNNQAFRSDWLKIWADIARNEGGKVTLTTAGIIIGTALGGVGVALMGTAFGLPLAAVLGIAGYVSGEEIDSMRRCRRESDTADNVRHPAFADSRDAERLGALEQRLAELTDTAAVTRMALDAVHLQELRIVQLEAQGSQFVDLRRHLKSVDRKLQVVRILGLTLALVCLATIASLT